MACPIADGKRGAKTKIPFFLPHFFRQLLGKLRIAEGLDVSAPCRSAET